MDKQVEEMANDLKKIKFDLKGCFVPQYVGVYEDITARELHDLGYRKIHENEVVLTQDELHERLNNAYDVGVESGKEVGSKATAEKILNEIMSTKTEDKNWSNNEPFVRFVNKVLDKCEELAKQFGVRI